MRPTPCLGATTARWALRTDIRHNRLSVRAALVYYRGEKTRKRSSRHDTTTCPDSASVYSLSTQTEETEETEESLYTLENQRLTLIECFSAWLRFIGAEQEM